MRSAGEINATVDGNDDLRKFHDDEIVAKNRLIIRKLESSHITVSHLLCFGTLQGSSRGASQRATNKTQSSSRRNTSFRKACCPLRLLESFKPTCRTKSPIKAR